MGAQDTPHIADHPAAARFYNEHDVISEQVHVILLTDDVRVARAATREIQRVLPGHLIVEEGPEGIFELIERANEALGPTVERLLKDHDRIRRALADAIRKEGAADEMEAMAYLAKLLETHEIRERAALEFAQRS